MKLQDETLHTQLMHWCKAKDLDLEHACVLLTGVAGAIAAHRGVSRWRWFKHCWRTYKEERHRMFAAKVGEVTK